MPSIKEPSCTSGLAKEGIIYDFLPFIKFGSHPDWVVIIGVFFIILAISVTVFISHSRHSSLHKDDDDEVIIVENKKSAKKKEVVVIGKEKAGKYAAPTEKEKAVTYSTSADEVYTSPSGKKTTIKAEKGITPIAAPRSSRSNASFIQSPEGRRSTRLTAKKASKV